MGSYVHESCVDLDGSYEYLSHVDPRGLLYFSHVDLGGSYI